MAGDQPFKLLPMSLFQPCAKDLEEVELTKR
jgi:hypothetical protein